MVADGLHSLLPADLEAVPAEVPELLLAAKRVLLTCHESPDADALGSSLGLGLALESLGARVSFVCADPVPSMYDFMPQSARFETALDPAFEPDLIVVCDCGDLARTGTVASENVELFERVPVVNIDHHVSNPGFGTIDWIGADSADPDVTDDALPAGYRRRVDRVSLRKARKRRGR